MARTSLGLDASTLERPISASSGALVVANTSDDEVLKTPLMPALDVSIDPRSAFTDL